LRTLFLPFVVPPFSIVSIPCFFLIAGVVVDDFS